MSIVNVQVHLPAHSHSFNISISSDSTIQDFKHAISITCPGHPQISGQRIILRGRVLNDIEYIRDIWKISEEPHVCHLAVHPSAWTSDPPNSAVSQGSANDRNYIPPPAAFFTRPLYAPPPTGRPTLPAVQAQAVQAQAVQAQAVQANSRATYLYIQYLHANALRILARQPRITWPEQYGSLQDARTVAKRGVKAAGRGWPNFLDNDIPPGMPENDNSGVTYTSTYIDNLPYLSLRTPDASPTPTQSHAIRVLSYTFPLLCINPTAEHPSNLTRVNPVAPPPVAPFPLQHQIGIERIRIRPLIFPLIMLFVRTCLLVYFFQPTRKPLMGIMVLLWVFWELLGAIRGALAGENGRRRRNAAPNGGNAVRPAGQENVGPNGAPPGNAAGPAPPNGAARQGDESNNTGGGLPDTHEVMDKLARINIVEEAKFVEPSATPDPGARPPTVLHQVKTFLVLLFLTLHPAIWDRRRSVLRAREGRVREDARTHEAQALQRIRERAEREESRRRGIDIGDQPEIEIPVVTPKPAWVMEYVGRVRAGDWVDDQ